MEFPLCEYRYHEGFKVTDQVKNDFNENGYILIRNLLDGDELKQIQHTLDGSDALMKHAYGAIDENGRIFNRINWGHPGSDVTGIVARCEKVAGTCEKLLGGEVYHYHTKLMMKPPRNGGIKAWHQDYGYWYNNGCLFPDMMTVFIPLDPCKKENGCLQILRGSHRCGRIDHVPNGREIDADVNRVNALMNQCPLQYIEMNAGDAVYFHCNLLHQSEANKSGTKRWAFAIAYNKATNDPIIEHHHPRYTPLLKVPNNAIKDCKNYTDMSGKDFLHPKETDKTMSLNSH